VSPPVLTTVRARALFAPLDEGGRAETVARRLARAIRLGLLLDGERLPAETQLATQFGVSTVTLREALAELRQMGLVETRRGRSGGSFVRVAQEPQPARLVRPLWLLSLHELRDMGDQRAAVAQSPRLTRAEMDLWSEVGDLLWLPVPDDAVAAIAGEHEALIAAIACGDPQRARHVAEQHVLSETERLIEFRLRLGEPLDPPES
jgi:GntR family transcriptional regulator, transcriptional repressor for pyruvate dehydrogenase complex